MKLRRIKEFLAAQFRIIMGNRFGIVGAVIIVFFCLVGLLAPVLAPHQPWDTLRDAGNKLAIMRPPSAEFPLGTTALGRDLYSQMLFATRTTVLIGLVSGLISIALGAMILAQWPTSGFWVIGLFVAIEMIFNGWSSVFVALAARKAAKAQPS